MVLLLLLLQEPLVRVTVRVQRQGEPVAGAVVRADTLRRVTDGQGEVRLLLTAGTHALRIGAIGFLPETVTVDLLPPRDTTITLALGPPLAELEAVTITATRTERRLEEEPARVEVLAGMDVAEKTEMRPSDLTMLLSEMVGVRTQVTAPSLGGAVVRIQGLRGHYTLFLTDGLPLHGAQSGGLSLLQVPPLDLQHVEVVKGAASALYGPAALGGVVNLVSRQPANDREVVVNQSSRGGSDGFLWMTRQLSERWGVTLIGDGHHQTVNDVSGDGWADFAGFTRGQVRPRVFWSAPGGSSVMATASVMTEDRSGGTVAGAVAPDSQPFAEDLSTRRADAGISGRFVLGGGRVVSLRAATSTQRRRRSFAAAVEHDRQWTGFGEASLTGAAGGVDWIVGASWQRETFRARDAAGLDYSYTTPALFAQITGSPVARFTGTASGRCDVQNRYGTYCTPRLSGLVQLSENWTLRLSGGTGFFAPTPFTEETEAIRLAKLAPLAGLKTERARNVAADFSATLGPLEVSGTVYASTIDRAVTLRSVAGDTTGAVELVNAVGPTHTFGAETFAVYEQTPWVVTVHYAYVRATEIDPTSGARRDVPLNPRHNVFVDLAYEDLPRGTWIALEADWTGRQPLDGDPYRLTSRPFFEAGLLVSQQLGRVKVFLNAHNFTNVRQSRYEPVLLPALGAGGRWTIDQWAPQSGRVINGGIRLRF
jgi:outer membrane receptor for ferrienterochelin and colicins